MQIRLPGIKNVSEELADECEKYIRAGALRKGEKLPSCRAMAGMLGINPNTVERAYSLLERRGLAVTLPKSGVFVAFEPTAKAQGTPPAQEPPPGGAPKPPPAEATAFDEAAARAHVEEMKRAGLTFEKALELVHAVYGGGGQGTAEGPADREEER